MGPSWSHLGPSWRHVGPSWWPWWPSWRRRRCRRRRRRRRIFRCGTLLGASGALVETPEGRRSNKEAALKIHFLESSSAVLGCSWGGLGTLAAAMKARCEEVTAQLPRDWCRGPCHLLASKDLLGNSLAEFATYCNFAKQCTPCGR